MLSIRGHLKVGSIEVESVKASTKISAPVVSLSPSQWTITGKEDSFNINLSNESLVTIDGDDN
jgi:hypothetical protein